MTRVVVYAEGPTELGTDRGGLPRSPGSAIPEPDCGPAHVLVQRLLARFGSHAAEIRFEAGLRTASGAVPRGSHLCKPRRVKQLVTWISPQMAPDLAVILVDRDGDARRQRELLDAMRDATTEVVLGVAQESFEAWLLADRNAIRAALGPDLDVPEHSDQLPPGEAKQRFQQLLAGQPLDRRAGILRAIAMQADLGVLEARSPSFAQFAGDLRGYTRRAPPPAP